MKRNKLLLAGLCCISPVFAFSVAAKHMGIGLNMFGSAPSGLWQKKEITRIERGMVISFCPPDVPIIKNLVSMRPIIKGDCPDTGSIEFIKAIGAMPGDTVILRKNKNVLINGREMQNTKASPVIAYPPGEYKVKPGEIWTFSSYNEQSYDSRYYGPVPIARITGEAVPVLIKGEVKHMTIGLTQ